MNIVIPSQEFLELRYRYERIGVPDPTLTAVREIAYPQRVVALPQDVRRQLESLVAYWHAHARPGRVLAALESRHYVKNLHNWKPKGLTQ